MIQYIIAAGIGALLGSSGKKTKKMGHGGKTQGYNSRLDESLSMRHGAGRKKQQTRKDRRDESAAMEHSMGRRKYASVSTMDMGRRKMAQGGTIEKMRHKHVEKVAERSINKMDSDDQRSSLREYAQHDIGQKFAERDKALKKAYEDKATFDLPSPRYYTSEFAHGGKTQGKVEIMLTDDDNGLYSILHKGKFIEKDFDSLKEAEDWARENGFSIKKSYAHGGKTQGYNARLDESLGMRRGSRRTKKQGYKSRRHESEGMERSMGRRKYASVGTMDKGRKRMAHGGMAGRISPMEMQQIILDKTGKLLDPSTQVFANEAGALGYLYALFGDYYTKSMQKGGKTSSAEERAFAEYMEDYGVDREEAEYQFLGEFRNREEWAAEYVENLGGIAQFADPERFLKVDKIGFREWAMNMAEALSSDLDDDELEDRAERHGLKFEYMEAEEMGGDAMKNFRREIEEKEYDEQYDYFMSEGESVEGVLDLIANYNGGDIEEALDQYVLEGDYDEVADAFEGDGVVFIEEDFKTFVFDPNMRRGGRTKCTSCNKNRMKKGGRTKSRKKVSDFDKLAMKVAARYRAEGKSNKEAMEIGRGTAAKVFRQQQAKGGAKRRKGRK